MNWLRLWSRLKLMWTLFTRLHPSTEVQTLTMQPPYLLVLGTNMRFSREQFERVSAEIAQHLPAGSHAVILEQMSVLAVLPLKELPHADA